MSDFIAGRIYIAGAFRVGLGQVGRKWLRVAYLTDGDLLVVGKVPGEEARGMTTLRGYESPQKLAKRLARNRRKAQGTKAAGELLQAAIAAE